MKTFKTNEKLDKVLKALDAGQLHQNKGIFFKGQIFDTYAFVADLIKNAKDETIFSNPIITTI